MTPDIEAGITERLWPEARQEIAVYVILDAARNDQIYPAVRNCGTEYVCLYSGNIPQELAKVAPYLVRLTKGHRFAKSVIRDGWGDSWGIFLRSPAALEDLRKHFHGLLTVKDEEGKRLVFRFYDPRVFNVYLPTCHSAELKAVFGPAEAFMSEARDRSILTEFRRQGDELGIEHHSLLRAFSRSVLDDDLTP